MSRKSYGALIVHGFTSSLDCVGGLEPPIQALGLPTRVPVLRGHCAESPAALCGVTWHEMFRDCERDATIATVVDYVRERAGLTA